LNNSNLQFCVYVKTALLLKFDDLSAFAQFWKKQSKPYYQQIVSNVVIDRKNYVVNIR
jgi:hypothetical protein